MNATSHRTPPRELAQRRSGADEVLLLWHPTDNRIEVSVRDSTTGEGFRIDVPPGRAIDAFYHPYVYAADPVNAFELVGAGARE